MNIKEFGKLVRYNYSFVKLDDELNSSDVEILYICLLCEKMYNINIETACAFNIYFKYLDNEVGISSYVVIYKNNILLIEIVDGVVVNIISEYDSIVKNVTHNIKESRC